MSSKYYWFGFAFTMIAIGAVVSSFRTCEDLVQESCYDPIPLSIPKYDFIDYTQNKLTFPGGDSAFQAFFAQLDRVIFEPNQHLSIVHMGGSHVQAGVLSHRLRQHFQNLSCDLDHERGLFFPFKLAKTNGPHHLKINRIGDWTSTRCAHNRQYDDWGMTGISVVSNSDTCGMDLIAYKSDSVRYTFNSLKLFHDGDALPKMCYPLPDSLRTNEKERLTQYFWNSYQDSLSLRIFSTDSTDCTIYGAIMENDQRGITYNAIGVNGASTRSYLRCPKIGSDFKHLNADLVIFGIGINDAYMSTDRFDEELFYSRYDSLASFFIAANPSTKFIWLTNNDSYYKKRYANKNSFKVSKQMNLLAEKYQGAVWDLFGVMGGLGSVKQWQSAGLAKADKIHFTEAGYELSADLFFDAFRQAYTQRIVDRINESIPLNQ